MLPRLDGEYERAYFAGIIAERRANVRLIGHASGSEAVAFDLFRQAMDFYERARAIRPAGNDDALLRWNSCARQIMRNDLQPARDENREPLMLE